MIAMDRVDRYRGVHSLDFTLVNQIHDALMIETSIQSIQPSKQMFKDTMGSIDIPVGPPFGTLRLGVDITVLTRWGEKQT